MLWEIPKFLSSPANAMPRAAYLAHDNKPLEVLREFGAAAPRSANRLTTSTPVSALYSYIFQGPSPNAACVVSYKTRSTSNFCVIFVGEVLPTVHCHNTVT